MPKISTTTMLIAIPRPILSPARAPPAPVPALITGKPSERPKTLQYCPGRGTRGARTARPHHVLAEPALGPGRRLRYDYSARGLPVLDGPGNRRQDAAADEAGNRLPHQGAGLQAAGPGRG